MLNEKTGRYRGESASGVPIEMMLDQRGGIDRVYPIYKGPKFEGPKK